MWVWLQKSVQKLTQNRRKGGGIFFYQNSTFWGFFHYFFVIFFSFFTLRYVESVGRSLKIENRALWLYQENVFFNFVIPAFSAKWPLFFRPLFWTNPKIRNISKALATDFLKMVFQKKAMWSDFSRKMTWPSLRGEENLLHISKTPCNGREV